MTTNQVFRVGTFLIFLALMAFVIKAISGVAAIATFGWGMLLSGIIVGIFAWANEK